MIFKNTQLYALAVLLLLPFWGLSQAPELFNYQAVVRDLSGTLLTNEEVDFRFTIRSGSTTGTIEYQEVHPLITTNSFGLVNLIIGQGNYISGSFSAIDWGNNTHYIEVELDPESDGSFLLMGTPQLISVPYALHAGNTFSGDYNDLINTPIDNDIDSLNELQQLSFTGTDLSITNGNIVDLSSLQDGIGTDNQNISGSGLSGTNLTIGIEDGSSEIIDLSSLQDGTGTDDQNISGSALNGTNLTIGIENGSSEIIDLSSLQDGTGTDNQNISGSGLSGTNLTIGIENGSSEIIDLSSLNTDDQLLSISGSTLSIEDGNSIDLSVADDQTMSLFGTFLSIDNGNTVDLSSLQDGTGTDDQFLSIIGSTLYIEDGNNVDLSTLDTDDQTLSLSGTDLTIADGNTVDLSSLQDGTGTDDQNISGSNLTGTDLTIGIEGGSSETIDLSGLDTDDQTLSLSGTDLTIADGNTIDLASLQDGTGTDDQNISGSNLTGTDLTIGIEGGNSETIDLSGLDTDDQTLSLSGTDLTIADGNTIDLSSLQDGTGTDDQNISGSALNGTDLTIGIEGGNSEIIDLSGLDTDDQTLSLSGTDLTIADGNTIDLASLQDGTGTDDQNISGSVLNGTDLTIGIEGGNSEIIDLSGLDTDDQTLSLSGTDLTIADGNTIDLSSLQDGTGTDDQLLSISGSTLSIEDGNSITLPSSPNYWTSSGSYLYNNTGSFIGIGTPSPNYNLEVAGDMGIDQHIYHNEDPDTYIEFSGLNNFDVWVGGANVIDATPGFGSSGNIAFPPVDIRMENIPATTLAVDDRVVVSNTSGYLKTVAQSSLVEDEVVEITNANHTTVAVNDNDLVRITEVISISGTFSKLDHDGLHISGGKISGTSNEIVYLNNNSVVEGVTFENVRLKGYSTTQFVACTFIGVTDFGIESTFQGCHFNSCTSTASTIGSIEGCEVDLTTLLRVRSISNCKIDDSFLGNASYSINKIANSEIGNTKVYLNDVFQGNSCQNTSIVIGTGNYGVSISNNTFDKKYSTEDNIIFLDMNGNGTTVINVTDNAFVCSTSLPQSIKISGTYTSGSSIGLIGVSGNIFSRGAKAIDYSSNIRTTINNNATTGTLSFGATQSLPNLVVRDNDVF